MIDTFSIRCSILRLAFSGKLSEQREADGTAKEMLLRISPKKSIEITEHTPYGIPDSWAWVRLADLYKINPKVDASGSTEAAFIPMERISAGFDRSFSFETQSWEQAAKNHTRFADGDVAFAKITPCFENRKSFIAQGLPNGIGGGTTELIILRQGEMLPEYTYYLLLDQRFISTGKASYKGTVGQQRVQSEVVKNYLIPVAPYAEQQRIAERIEQAFSVLDTIDALQAQYADNLTVLKSKLIDLAIRGKLTEQLPEDGTAEELYQQIQAEKQSLIKSGKIKKEKPLPEISEDEILFEIPDNWKWARLGDVSVKISSGSTPTGGKKAGVYVEKGIPFFREQNIYNDGIHKDGLVYITEELLSTRKNSTVVANDVLLNITGGSIGRCALIPEDFDRGSINQHILIIRMINPAIRFFVHLFICSSFVQNYIKDKSVGDKDGFSGGRCKNMIMPLPPIAEQKRIVDRLDQILAACDEMR